MICTVAPGHLVVPTLSEEAALPLPRSGMGYVFGELPPSPCYKHHTFNFKTGKELNIHQGTVNPHTPGKDSISCT